MNFLDYVFQKKRKKWKNVGKNLRWVVLIGINA